MTATQAPTPGPLSVGDRVVAVADLRKHPDGPVWVKKGEEVGIVREYGVGNCIAGVALQDGREGDWAKSCFRLAPTAPVEASGSEREHGPKCWGKTSISDEMMYCYCGSTDSPPGETREALDRLKMAAHVYEDDEMAADCATLEALLSARPLALGGQHSTATDFPPDDVLACDTTPARAEAQDEDTPCTDCGDTGVTHQTERRCSCQEAEAQDEGAAVPSFRDVFLSWHEECGTVERAGPCASPIGKFEVRWPDFRKRLWDAAMKSPDALRDEWVKIAKECAHPSPPPAADEDRLRIAVEALEEIAHLIKISPDVPSDDFDRGARAARFQAFDIANPALAALKSTYAKERGE